MRLMPYDLTTNGKTVPRGTLREVIADIAELVTTRLAAAPERIAPEAQALKTQCTEENMEREIAETGQFFTVLDAYGPDPVRIKVTRGE